jgi:hypothetical protein
MMPDLGKYATEVLAAWGASLVLLAGIILIGRYTGYRLSELIRFKNFEEAA